MTISEAEQVASGIAQSGIMAGTDVQATTTALNTLISAVRLAITAGNGDVQPTNLLLKNALLAVDLLPSDRTSNAGRRL